MQDALTISYVSVCELQAGDLVQYDFLTGNNSLLFVVQIAPDDLIELNMRLSCLDEEGRQISLRPTKNYPVKLIGRCA
jgi:hypothetical protein